jgi:hypothetical protein
VKEDRGRDLSRQIEQLDAQIDALVYKLHELTEEEIAGVAGRWVSNREGDYDALSREADRIARPQI